MERKRIITVNDYQRLTGLVEFETLKKKMPEIVSRLSKELSSAEMLPQAAISGNIITMNSRVVMKDISSEREAELTITYPHDANNRERKVSIFSTIGIALLGKQVGDIVSWKTPAGNSKFEISKVTYQPEAVGDYSL